MTREEINAIEDIGLREIRMKYWNLFNKAFLDEQGIPDSKLGDVVKNLEEEEAKEIADYLSNKK